MDKIGYIKPEIEIIKVELQSSIMMGSVDVNLDPSNTTDGKFDSKKRIFWDE